MRNYCIDISAYAYGVGWLVFNATLGTNRLYHAVHAMNVSNMAGGQTHNTHMNKQTKTILFNLIVER